MATSATDMEKPLAPTDKLKWCWDNLGARITAFALNENDASRVQTWQAIGIPEDALSKVGILYDAGVRVADVYDEETARAFLRSSNPTVGDQSLLAVIAGGEEASATLVDQAIQGFVG